MPARYCFIRTEWVALNSHKTFHGTRVEIDGKQSSLLLCRLWLDEHIACDGGIIEVQEHRRYDDKESYFSASSSCTHRSVISYYFAREAEAVMFKLAMADQLFQEPQPPRYVRSPSSDD